MISEIDIIKLTGATERELRGHRYKSMIEGQHYVHRGPHRKVLYLAAGVQLLNEAGIRVALDAQAPVDPVATVVIVACPANRPSIKNPRVMLGQIAGVEVTVRCRDNANFMPGMEVPCDCRDGLYYVKRHPRFRGKW